MDNELRRKILESVKADMDNYVEIGSDVDLQTKALNNIVRQVKMLSDDEIHEDDLVTKDVQHQVDLQRLEMDKTRLEFEKRKFEFEREKFEYEEKLNEMKMDYEKQKDFEARTLQANQAAKENFWKWLEYGLKATGIVVTVGTTIAYLTCYMLDMKATYKDAVRLPSRTVDLLKWLRK